MSTTVFNVKFQFDKDKIERIILETSLSGKGYVCFVDVNSLTMSFKNNEYNHILNSSLANSCDGSYIALMANLIYKTKYKEYIGPDFFEKMIYLPVKHIIIGGNEHVFKGIFSKVAAKLPHPEIKHIELPFKDVDDFDYQIIANEINDFKPRLIWVSLGAPKQEIFMSKIIPYVEKGVLIGVGAAYNFFTGEVKDIPQWARKTHLIWFYRLISEPKKQIKRFTNAMLTIFSIFFTELKKKKKEKESF